MKIFSVNIINGAVLKILHKHVHVAVTAIGLHPGTAAGAIYTHYNILQLFFVPVVTLPITTEMFGDCANRTLS